MILLIVFVYHFLTPPTRMILVHPLTVVRQSENKCVLWFCLPAAKCSGVDLRPAMSFAFTFTASTSFFTLETSPLRQASNSSLKAPFALPLLLPLPGSLLPESGVEPALVPLPSVVVGELALLLVLLLLLLLLRAGAGEVVVVGEAGAASPSAVFSILSPWESGVASSAGPGGEPGGVPGRIEPRGGEDSKEFGCCCWEERRGVAIFTTQQSPLATKTLLTISCRAKSNFRSDTGITFTGFCGISKPHCAIYNITEPTIIMTSQKKKRKEKKVVSSYRNLYVINI